MFQASQAPYAFICGIRFLHGSARSATAHLHVLFEGERAVNRWQNERDDEDRLCWSYLAGVVAGERSNCALVFAPSTVKLY